MILLRAVVAFLQAATAFLKVWPVIESRKIIREIEAYEDEIIDLGYIGDADSKLRIEEVARRKLRASKQLSFVRSSYGDTDAGE